MSALPPLPAACDPDSLIRDWCTAVEAYHRTDSEGVAAALFPQMPARETYTRTVGFTILAAALCGERIREGHDRSPLGFWELQVTDLRTGQPVNPDHLTGVEDDVALARLVTAAANHDYNLVNDLVFAYMPPGCDPERSLLLGRLLVIYCANEPR